MTTIVTRAGKGSPLTHTEMDANFTNLNTNKTEVADLASTSTNKGAALVGYALALSGATSSTVQEKLKESVSVEDFMTAADRTTNYLAPGSVDVGYAFNAALAVSASVYAPATAYLTSQTITIGVITKQRLYGKGKAQTRIISNSTTLPLIHFNGSVAGLSLAHLTLDRSVVPTSTAHGIEAPAIGEYFIDNIVSKNHYIGATLGEAGYSYIRDSEITANLSNGIFMQTGNTGQLQWSFRKLLIDQNGGDGLGVATLGSAAISSLGEWEGISTFANTGKGVSVIGTAGKKIYGVRISGAFIGQDGDTEVFLDTYGGGHKIHGSFFELAGTGPTGPTLSTPASNIGKGIHITANNINVSVIGNTVSGCSLSGIDVASTVSLVSNNYVYNCGVALVAGERAGIRLRAGYSTATGNTSENVGSAVQQFGIFADVDTVTIVGNTARNNATSDITGTVAPPIVGIYVGNKGTTQDNLTQDLYRDGVKILSTRNTGWVAMTGTADESNAYDTDTIGLVNLARRVKAIQDALTTHGLIGA